MDRPGALLWSPRWLLLGVMAAGWLASVPAAHGQAIGVQEFRPFVLGVVPVVRNGAVGGISIDPAGLVARASEAETERLVAAHRRALQDIAVELDRPSPLRKISLRLLERALDDAARRRQPIGDELRYLAGLQRVQYLFVYPDRSDIVLAGPAEGWRVDQAGQVVGPKSGLPPLELEDLITLLAHGDPDAPGVVACSIDPDPAAMRKVQRFVTSRRFDGSEAALHAAEETLGPQTVRLEGVPPHSHVARVLLATDYRMKRLAMGLEPAPVPGLPSYLELLGQSQDRSGHLLPRWWLAPQCQEVLVSIDRLAWEIRDLSVAACTEDQHLNAAGVVQTGRTHRAARDWAERMTARYDDLAKLQTTFAQLRQVMDLAVVTALLDQHRLYGAAGWSLPQLRDPAWHRLTEYEVPRQVPSQAGLHRWRGKALVSISGGVEIDPSQWVMQPAETDQLTAPHQAARPAAGLRWWWD